MVVKRQLAFSSGEIDPVLHDRVTLERFQNGLATARNVMVRKTGAVMSRFGREYVSTAAVDAKVKIYVIPDTGQYIEIVVNESNQGSLILRDFDGANVVDYNLTDPDPTGYGYPLTYDNIDDLHFDSDKDYVYIFGGPKTNSYPLRFKYTTTRELLYQNDIFEVPPPPLSATGSGTGSTNYEIDYAVTYVYNGEESEELEIPSAPTYLPTDVGDTNTLEITVSNDISLIDNFKEVRVYRRPIEGSAYGFVGKTTNIYVDGSEIKAKFVDYGQDADFGNGIPFSITEEGLNSLSDVGQYKVGTGVIYQQRLLLANLNDVDNEAIIASRPAYRSNFYRDFPYSDDSALKFKAGASGKAEVLRMVDSDGLVVFTTRGVYVNSGILSPTNNVLVKRGGWVIDEKIPPLVIPGGLFFVDKATNSVRQLVYSNDNGTYVANDQSIFSDHFFTNKTIKSWAYQQGSTPVLIVTFSDGTFATYTYDYEHQMRAWTRHDSKWFIEQVEGTDEPDVTLFLINKNGTRHIEKTIPRIIPAEVLRTDSEARLRNYAAFMDETTSFNFKWNDFLTGDDVFTLTPVTPDDWEGNLTLNAGTSTPFAPPFIPGGTYRWFNPKDGSYIDFTGVSKTSDSEIVVTPSEEFPEEYSSGFNLYGVRVSLTGLNHLEGEEVSILGDGNIVSSPNNDSPEDQIPTFTVTSGSITLPEAYSFITVGLPITADIKTLNVSTAEQRNLMLESLTNNKSYIRVVETRGLFFDNNFPEEEVGDKDGNSVEPMQSLSSYIVPENTPIIGNRRKPDLAERVEVTTQGDWYNNGQVAIRQVDPFHFTILSIISDMEVLNRSN